MAGIDTLREELRETVSGEAFNHALMQGQAAADDFLRQENDKLRKLCRESGNAKIARQAMLVDFVEELVLHMVVRPNQPEETRKARHTMDYGVPES